MCWTAGPACRFFQGQQIGWCLHLQSQRCAYEQCWGLDVRRHDAKLHDGIHPGPRHVPSLPMRDASLSAPPFTLSVIGIVSWIGSFLQIWLPSAMLAYAIDVNSSLFTADQRFWLTYLGLSANKGHPPGCTCQQHPRL